MSGLSPAQLAKRLTGVTATDAAAIVRCHPWVSPLDVWLEKRGLAPPRADSQRSHWGQILEGPIRDDYEHRHGVRVEVPGTIRHERDRWKLATPDGLVYFDRSLEPERGLEIKVHGRDAVYFGGLEYGAPGTDEVPKHELVQSMWGLDCCSRAGRPIDRWDLVVFTDGAPTEYVIDRDDELIGMLSEECERFFVDYIRTGEPPPPDGSEAWDAWLKRRYPRQTTDALVSIDTDPELRALVYQLRECRNAHADAKLAREIAEQALKLAIGERGGLTWREFGRGKPDKITWRASSGHSETDWKAWAQDIRNRAELALSGITNLVRAAEPDAVSEILKLAGETLALIASGDTVADHTKEISGGRPLQVPRHWKKAHAEEKTTATAPAAEQ